MPEPSFDTPLFIQEKNEATVDITVTPFFYNDDRSPTYSRQPPAGVTPLTLIGTDPSMAVGYEHAVATVLDVKPSPPWSIATQLGIAVQQVVFEPLWVTREIAAAFGVTLVEPGQAIQITSPVTTLQQIEYEYGAFAAHWSPYQGTGNTLLRVVCADLEHHDFPHIFTSTDPAQPLVISVGRYWPERGKIRPADLWVPRNSALYIPPMPAQKNPACIDLHGNRNSARACWGGLAQNSIVTHTLLQNKTAISIGTETLLPPCMSDPRLSAKRLRPEGA